MSGLFILVADSGHFQGLKRALNNHFLLDKDAYPTTMPQALKLLEKFKAEVGITPKGRAESGDESGVAFAQAQNWAQSVVCYNCDVMGHRVNEYPRVTHAQRKKFWEDNNISRCEKANTEPKEDTANYTVAEVVTVVPAEDDDAHIKCKRYQRLMSAME